MQCWRQGCSVERRGIVCELTWSDLCLACVAVGTLILGHVCLAWMPSSVSLYVWPAITGWLGVLGMGWLWQKPALMRSWSPCANRCLRAYVCVLLITTAGVVAGAPFTDVAHRQWMEFWLAQWCLWTVFVFFAYNVFWSSRTRYNALPSESSGGGYPEAEQPDASKTMHIGRPFQLDAENIDPDLAKELEMFEIGDLPTTAAPAAAPAPPAPEAATTTSG